MDTILNEVQKYLSEFNSDAVCKIWTMFELYSWGTISYSLLTTRKEYRKFRDQWIFSLTVTCCALIKLTCWRSVRADKWKNGHFALRLIQFGLFKQGQITTCCSKQFTESISQPEQTHRWSSRWECDDNSVYWCRANSKHTLSQDFTVTIQSDYAVRFVKSFVQFLYWAYMQPQRSGKKSSRKKTGCVRTDVCCSQLGVWGYRKTRKEHRKTDLVKLNEG